MKLKGLKSYSYVFNANILKLLAYSDEESQVICFEGVLY